MQTGEEICFGGLQVDGEGVLVGLGLRGLVEAVPLKDRGDFGAALAGEDPDAEPESPFVFVGEVLERDNHRLDC